MKVRTIVSVMERYTVLKSKVYQDKLNLENYRTLEPDEQKEKEYMHKLRYDNAQLGKFLNEEV